MTTSINNKKTKKQTKKRIQKGGDTVNYLYYSKGCKKIGKNCLKYHILLVAPSIKKARDLYNDSKLYPYKRTKKILTYINDNFDDYEYMKKNEGDLENYGEIILLLEKISDTDPRFIYYLSKDEIEICKKYRIPLTTEQSDSEFEINIIKKPEIKPVSIDNTPLSLSGSDEKTITILSMSESDEDESFNILDPISRTRSRSRSRTRSKSKS